MGQTIESIAEGKSCEYVKNLSPLEDRFLLVEIKALLRGDRWMEGNAYYKGFLEGYKKAFEKPGNNNENPYFRGIDD